MQRDLEMKKLLIALGLLVLAAVIVVIKSGNQQVSQNTSAPMPVGANPTSHSHDGYGMDQRESGA
jgi:hypothetical protein